MKEYWKKTLRDGSIRYHYALKMTHKSDMYPDTYAAYVLYVAVLTATDLISLREDGKEIFKRLANENFVLSSPSVALKYPAYT